MYTHIYIYIYICIAHVTPLSRIAVGVHMSMHPWQNTTHNTKGPTTRAVLEGVQRRVPCVHVRLLNVDLGASNASELSLVGT